MKPWLISIAWTLAGASGAAGAAQSCEDLRSQIESKISGAGVSNFKVIVVQGSEAVRGQVVGSCELGTRKIVYQRDSIPVPRNERILTECKDGTVSVGGDCKP
jgi:Protein of unknown function (DUF1161)